MISSVNLMTGCNFFYQIISAGRTNGHGGPHVARGPRVGRAWSKVSRYLGRDTIRVSRSHVSRCIDASMHRYTPTKIELSVLNFWLFLENFG